MVGDAQHITVSGGLNDEHARNIRGNYERRQLYNGMPTYVKLGGPCVLYFWHDRNDSGNNGWWFGPAIGSDIAWGRHRVQHGHSAPTRGYNVPFSGAVDHTVVVRKSRWGCKVARAVLLGNGMCSFKCFTKILN